MFNLFFCILQKPTSEAIVTAAKIFRKEPLTHYHCSLNEEAAMLAENDPSLLTNRDELLQKAREALLARDKYQFKKGRSRSKILGDNSTERESRPKRVKIDEKTRKPRITEIEESMMMKSPLKKKDDPKLRLYMITVNVTKSVNGYHL